ncbi:unnamed protein product [Effrenium voratum]|nr:unnamed protein product [Effrenium voratum]
MVGAMLRCLLLLWLAEAEDQSDAALVVDTANGPVLGVWRDGASASWWGIPFAEPPLGKLRFREPQALSQTWTTPRPSKIPPECAQRGGSKGVKGQEDCLYLNVHAPAQTNASRPVLVWIYGGGFSMGSSYELGLYDGHHLSAKHEVVVVTLNYRLSALGFMALDALQGEQPAGSTGNHGVQEDQQLALRWVQRNIAAFGGDATRVTVFGESAGAFSVMWHLVSPHSAGLFQSAIMESGTVETSLFFQPLEKAKAYYEELAERLHCPKLLGPLQLPCLRALPPELILAVEGGADGWRPMQRSTLWPVMPTGPAVDGTDHGLPDVPLKLVKQGRFNKVPLLLGANENGGSIFEMMLPEVLPGAKLPLKRNPESLSKALDLFFRENVSKVEQVYTQSEYLQDPDKMIRRIIRDLIFLCPARALASAWAQQGLPAYLYVFDFNYGLAKMIGLGDFHGAELPFVFRNWLEFIKPIDPLQSPWHMADIMSCKWASFATVRDPNGGDEASWPPGCQAVNRKFSDWPAFEAGQRFFYGLKSRPDVHAILKDNRYPDDLFPRDEKCDLWDQLGMYMPWVQGYVLNTFTRDCKIGGDLEAAEWDGELGRFVEQQLALRLQQELQESRAKLRPQQRSEAPAEALRLAGQAQRILATEPAEVYSDIGAIALALCCAGRSEPANAGISGRWREMRVASTWQQHLARLCDTTWCYWLRDLLPMLLAEVSASAVQPLFVAFAQPLTVLPEGVARHSFLRELREVLEASVVQPLCAKVEEDLRLLVHATMQGTREALPAAPPEEVLGLLQLRPLRLSDAHVVDLRDQVELRLSRHFYDLAALAPQDAEAYARMREAAAQRYGLHLLDGGLPAGSLAQGLDVIDVMRNVHLLATQYCYCLHQQFFTQAFNQGEAKVRTITVEHLAASIRVHGYGVINTAVNYSVGFLKKKLEVVAQFLADESVKSRLLTEKQWMEGRQGYSWARAVETARFIRRLGAGRDGVSYLDKLRQVLTQIGNSLGYVRMIRTTAGMRSMANGLEYLEAAPWLGDGGMSNRSDLAQAAEAAGCDPPVQEAARLAEAAARSVRRCFEASTDHLNLLAEVFAKALSRPEAMPTTRLFHLLVPSVGCAFLDSLLLGRETLAKRAVAPSGVKGEALLTDDGFAVGVAFVLRVFGLQRDFQSLHWFQTEINDSDMTTGQARAAAGLPFQESRGEADRRSKLAAELSNLAAALEASGALFGAAKTPAREEPVVESEAVES